MYCIPSACQPGSDFVPADRMILIMGIFPFLRTCWHFFLTDICTGSSKVHLSSSIYATCSAELVGREMLVDREYSDSSAASHCNGCRSRLNPARILRTADKSLNLSSPIHVSHSLFLHHTWSRVDLTGKRKRLVCDKTVFHLTGMQN